MNFKTDHEVRGIPDIVSEGRPQRRARRNRIARATMAVSKAVNVAAVRDAAESTEAEKEQELGNEFSWNKANGSATTRRETVEVLPVRRMLADASARYRTSAVAHAELDGRAACDGLVSVFAERRAIRRIFSICRCRGVAAVRSADSNAERCVAAGETANRTI